MHLHHLNLLAILVAAIAAMVVGFIWYSPLLFAKPWTREMGYDPDDKESMDKMKKSAGPAYMGSTFASLVMAFTLALFFEALHTQDLHHGLAITFHAWLGFVAMVQLTDALFTKKSMKLFAINTGYQLVSMLAMGVILILWR
jgi:hypothetical protein